MSSKRRIDVRTPVAQGFSTPQETAAWAFVPDASPIDSKPTIVFAWPGGTYSKHYFDFELDGFPGYSMADYLTERGFFVVACDHLGQGGSSYPPVEELTLDKMVDANQQMVEGVLERFRSGTLAPGLDPIEDAFLVGLGHSMGGALLTKLQARYETFDAIGIVSHSGIYYEAWPETVEAITKQLEEEAKLDGPPPGYPPHAPPGYFLPTNPRPPALRWSSHWEDVPVEIMDWDDENRTTSPPPAVAMQCAQPGATTKEAGQITVPVFISGGVRDEGLREAHKEPTVYTASRDITVFVQPRAGHQPFLASTREMLWSRFATWARSVRETWEADG